jgi:F-type H+-transporting ATPase subunit b
MFISDAFAATAANSSAPAAKGVFPPFDVSTFPAQLFWLVITFGTLYFVMSRIALPRVAKIIDTRRLRIDNDLAEEAGAHYERTLADAKATVQKSVQDVRDNLAADSNAKRKALEINLNAHLAEAEAKIAAGKAQAMYNVSAIATEAAGAIVRQITGRDADPQALAKAVAGQNV